MSEFKKLLTRDLRAAPRAFVVSGPVDEQVLIAWLARQDRAIPEDLLTLWRTIGGGELDESETILVPGGVEIYCGEFARLNADYDLDAQNVHLWEAGMSTDFLVFHHGAGWLVGIDRVGAVVELNQATYEPVGAFASVEDWYRTVRDQLYGVVR